MNNQIKSDFDDTIKNLNLDKKYSMKELKFLKEIGDIAREFQREYKILKEQEPESTYQMKK